MIRFYIYLKQRMAEEHGSIMITTIFFLFCLGGLLSLLLFLEQTDLLKMKMQHTADLISKGARAAGKWEYVDSEGEKQMRLFATTAEAEQQEADIIRGAREEAEILWQLNSSAFDRGNMEAYAIHQKGERSYLYLQGIYHVRVEAASNVPTLWEDLDVKLGRVSQSGIYD
ncbi:hypothetical protein [Brevibacillus sp. NRS-1366]|uniref:hypothetical protein n=1 Tax=Brevibacillus sp. NRS-1366 TaxID=3233899 RepID=UPI003D25D9E4